MVFTLNWTIPLFLRQTQITCNQWVFGSYNWALVEQHLADHADVAHNSRWKGILKKFQMTQNARPTVNQLQSAINYAMIFPQLHKI